MNIILKEYQICFYDIDITITKEDFFNILDELSVFYQIVKKEYSADCKRKYLNYYLKNISGNLLYIGCIYEVEL